MCVGCGYAALHADFEKAVDAKTKKFVREVLAEPTKSELRGMMGFKVPPKLSLDFLRLEDVPDTLEYENALQVYSFRQAPAQVLARLHLEASYACRRELCAPIMCEHIFRAIRKMDKMLIDPENLDATIPEKVSWAKKLVRETGRQDEKLSRDELYCISIRLAGCYARLGEGWNARDELITALSYADGGDPARATALKKIVRDRLSLLGREARHQSMACDYMTEVIEKGTFEGEDLLNAVYLVGEMCKRLGRLEEAVAWFRAARAFTAEKNEGLAKLAEKALSNPLLKRAEPDAETVSGPLKLLGLDKELERALSEIKEREKKKQEEKTDVVKVAVERASMTCEQILARIYRAVVEYEKSRGKIPSGFDDLTNAGLLTPEDANGFVCPESQHPLFYKKPKRLAGRDFVVYHKDPLRCPCRLVLLADGTIGTVDE